MTTLKRKRKNKKKIVNIFSCVCVKIYRQKILRNNHSRELFYYFFFCISSLCSTPHFNDSQSICIRQNEWIILFQNDKIINNRLWLIMNVNDNGFDYYYEVETDEIRKKHTQKTIIWIKEWNLLQMLQSNIVHWLLHFFVKFCFSTKKKFVCFLIETLWFLIVFHFDE